MKKSVLPLVAMLLSASVLIAGEIEIRGKVINPCTVSKPVKIRDYNVMGSEFKEVPVVNGAFSYKMNITDPKQITVKAGVLHIDFLATDKEKVYNLELYCDKTNGDTIMIKNSNENNAFIRFYYASRNLQENLMKLGNSNLAVPDNFAKVKKGLLDYQTKIKALAAASPGSFTATTLIPSEMIPEANLASIDALRKGHFKRDILSNPVYYSTFLSSRIVLAYMTIRDRADHSNKWIDDAMTVAAKNPESAKRLQQVFYDLFYFRKEEKLLVAYQQWANAHPQSMLNPVVKAQLKNLESIMAGSQYTDMALKDPKGNLHKLSETVASAKLTLLIFYSPTCNHCQEQLPQLVPVFNKYKSKGLKIYAVGYEGTASEWNGFIKRYGTADWLNVWETMEMQNRPTIKYVVNVTPALILIDQNGKIIERFDEMPEVINKISKRLN